MSGIYVLFFLVGGAVIGYNIYRYYKAKQAWQAFALDENFDYGGGGVFSNFQMNGAFRGREVGVWTEKRGHGKSKKKYTVYQASLPADLPFGLELYDESLFSKLGKVFGGEDIQVGRSALDDAFIIKGSNPTEVRAFLDDDRVERELLDLHAFESDLEIEHGELTIEHRRLAHTQGKIRRYLDALVACADVLAERVEEMERGQLEETFSPSTKSSSTDSEDEESPEEIDYVAEW